LQEGCASQRRDCRQELASIADRSDADVFEVVSRQLRQYRRIDLVVPEIRFVLFEAETTKPPADIHSRAPHGFAG
jgi:hypothetical protein